MGPYRPGERVKLGEAECRASIPVRIRWENGAGFVVQLGTEILSGDDADRLAHADGFEDAAAMGEWLERAYGMPFRGLLVRW